LFRVVAKHAPLSKQGHNDIPPPPKKKKKKKRKNRNSLKIYHLYKVNHQKLKLPQQKKKKKKKKKSFYSFAPSHIRIYDSAPMSKDEGKVINVSAPCF
jgi:hypothetical protein